MVKWMLLILALAASAAWAQPTVVVEWNKDLETGSWSGYYLSGSRDRGVVLTETEKALSGRYSALPPAGSSRDRSRMRELQRQQSVWGQRGRNRSRPDTMSGAEFICFVTARTTGCKYRESYSRFLRKQAEDVTIHVDLQLMEVSTGETVKFWAGEGSARARSRDRTDYRPIVEVATRHLDRDARDLIRIFAPEKRKDERSDRQRMWAEVIASAIQNALTDAHVVAPQLLSAGK